MAVNGTESTIIALRSECLIDFCLSLPPFSPQVSLGPLNKIFNKVRPVVASAVLRFPVSKSL